MHYGASIRDISKKSSALRAETVLLSGLSATLHIVMKKSPFVFHSQALVPAPMGAGYEPGPWRGCGGSSSPLLSAIAFPFQ